eukprot:365117-Chlamydomonas_euryale.AAC.7
MGSMQAKCLIYAAIDVTRNLCQRHSLASERRLNMWHPHPCQPNACLTSCDRCTGMTWLSHWHSPWLCGDQMRDRYFLWSAKSIVQNAIQLKSDCPAVYESMYFTSAEKSVQMTPHDNRLTEREVH